MPDRKPPPKSGAGPEKQPANEASGHDGFLGEKRLDPLKLNLDPQNPRLDEDERGATQDRLREILLERFKLEELGDAIVAIGFLEFDPIVAVKEDDAVVVLEGNRRLAALKLLLNPDLAPPSRRAAWKALAGKFPAEYRARVERISVQLYKSRSDPGVRSYIGFRHVSGVLQWPSVEKANFIADLVDKGWSYEQIAERLGTYPRHVERHYIAHQIVRQAEEAEVPGAKEMKSSFGILLRSLQSPLIASFLGVEFPHDSTKSKEPISANRLEELRLFALWTFGTTERKRILPDSRDLTRWGKILTTPDAFLYLKRSERPDFERAWFRSGGQAESLSQDLFAAADRLQQSVPIVSEHKDVPEVQAAVRECARYLSQILHSFPEVAKQHGLPMSP